MAGHKTVSTLQGMSITGPADRVMGFRNLAIGGLKVYRRCMIWNEGVTGF